MAVAVSIASASLWRAGVCVRETGDLGNCLCQAPSSPGDASSSTSVDRVLVCARNATAGPASLPAQYLFQVSSLAAIVSRKRRRTSSTATGAVLAALGQQCGQLVGGLDVAYQGVAALGVADQIQGIAQQTFGDVTRTLKETARLHVDAAAELPGSEVCRQRLFAQVPVRKAVATHQKERAEGVS
jgi:hypothetical protein